MIKKNSQNFCVAMNDRKKRTEKKEDKGLKKEKKNVYKRSLLLLREYSSQGLISANIIFF